jgi:uncharacterized protein with HEPN domain
MTIDKDTVLVQHILDAILAINSFVQDVSLTEFVENDLVSSAVMKKFEVIGEASNKLSSRFREKHANIPWSKIVGMRNILIHDYIGADLEGVWNTIGENLPELKTELMF